MKFLSLFDHDEISVKLGNMEIIDHTNYPKTLDPTKQYSQHDEIEERKILTRRGNSYQDDYMLDM